MKDATKFLLKRCQIKFMFSDRAFSYMNLDNVAMVEQLYAQFLQDPLSIDPSWRHFFEGMEFGCFEKIDKIAEDAGKDQNLRIYLLINAYRRFGHLQAAINPIGTQLIRAAAELSLQALNFNEKELQQQFPTLGFFVEPKARLAEILDALKETYCKTIGIEYMGLHSLKMEEWIQKKIEPIRFRPEFSIEQKKQILSHLNKAELFETFLHTKYVGQKRFSLEGGETLIPILAEIVERGAQEGIDEFIIGMAHRGRLNVLANILNKSYSMVFSEFEDYLDPHLIEGAGDVKYHKGFSANVTTSQSLLAHISLMANPSHLESVDPLVVGKSRGKQALRKDVTHKKVVPILIHGDASLAGQGVVYETLQLTRLGGYDVGGTLHIVVNNQIGFTTLPFECRSSRYCTDIAVAFGFPVFHVNAEDPEGCIFATQLALSLRNLFGCDVFIDLNCYRKYGHNESDEPAFTQPLEYQIIRQKKTIREIYRDRLIEEGILEREMALALEEEFKKALHFELEELKMSKEAARTEAFEGVWKEYEKPSMSNLFQRIETKVELKVLKEIGRQLCTVPNALSIHKKLLKLIEERQKMVEGARLVDWAMGELFAFGTLLWEGIHVRFSGQDSQRGTFTQRHAVWVDQKTGGRYFPLAHLCETQAEFAIYNSPLSEFASLGFELGYSLAFPAALVIWEAQFGDFANGAQVIFDQYLAASAKKWQRYSGLVVLLPHGYEGQGAEHSSARLERFLQLSAELNQQVVYPTTPAQYFHLIRRQVKRKCRLPLVVLTPKGLLRHPKCVSALDEFSNGSFHEILDDPISNLMSTRLILCSGRIYYDLSEERQNRQAEHIAIVRIEQLYPLHEYELKQVLARYKQVNKYVWVQEEPENMGAYAYIFPLLKKILPDKASLDLIARPGSAVSATGSHTFHEKEQKQLMDKVFGD